MLIFNVAQLEKSPVGTTREYQVDDQVDIDGYMVTVKGEVQLIRTNLSVLVKANLETALPLECCRCLRDFDCALKVTFQEEFLPTLDVMSGLPVDVEDPDETFTIDEHHDLDLREAVRQYVILSQPMKPLCRMDCPGIAPKFAS
ncbi:DUF177 domain-containing protein [Dehalogenimonas sp. THU2]|uniref:YceD family protein n=1 Tax=Dehalogenimonas sp. THU2 TaxID=3151121 RepID=UPI0032187630